jgi:hypothetical protein
MIDLVLQPPPGATEMAMEASKATFEIKRAWQHSGPTLARMEFRVRYHTMGGLLEALCEPYCEANFTIRIERRAVAATGRITAWNFASKVAIETFLQRIADCAAALARYPGTASFECSIVRPLMPPAPTAQEPPRLH